VTMAVRGSGGIELTGVFNRAPRVLIADDDWLNRDLLEAYLVSSGCEVVTAADGVAALDLARAAPLDLALCHTAFNCTRACPREIQVTRAIGEVKQAVTTGRLT